MLIDVDSEISQARELLCHASHVVVLTGAGISTNSGIPDFRGPEGLWTKDPDAEMLSTFDAYVNSEEVRRRAWLSRLDSPTWTATPNAGHLALVELERRGVLDTLITQNIDGLHHAAGNDPARIIEIHGNVRDTVCLRCGDRRSMDEALGRLRSGESDPSCLSTTVGEACGGILKSATISFGQSLIAEDLERADAAAHRCDLMLAIGSTLSVFPAAGVVPTASRSGTPVIIINGEPTAMDHLASAVVRGDISEALRALIAPAP